jgi:SAM-dependent methyltransferase
VSESPVCRLCGSTRSELVSRAVSGAPESAVYRCLDCSLVYLFPIMTDIEEAAFYRAEFEEYMQSRAGAGWQSPAAHYHAKQPEGERRLPLARPHLRPADDLLEIGSSTGYFLDDLRGYVRSVAGVEPSQAYRHFSAARGIDTVADLAELGQRTFDVIALYYVLEHLRDPIGYLSDLRARLNPGGRLLVEVPNVDDALLTAYTIPGFPPFYWQKAHYFNFSQRTLCDVLSRAGYSAQVVPVQRYDLSNHMVWMMEGRPGGTGRFKYLFRPEVETAYAEALKAQWVCDTIFAVATIK